MANLNIRVEDELKRHAEFICNELGMSLSTAITIFLKQVIRYGGIPFDLKLDPSFYEENRSQLFASRERMEKAGGVIHALLKEELSIENEALAQTNNATETASLEKRNDLHE